MKTRAVLSAMCIAAMATLATAQDQPAAAPMPTVQGTVSNPRDTTLPADAHTINEADRTFIAQAAVGGLFEVQSSQAATTSAQDQNVKAFAQQMIQDHMAANQKLVALAAAKHVAAPATLDVKHIKMLSNLLGKQGAQFDGAYVRAQVKAHREAVSLFEKAASSATDADVKQFAATTLPTLQHHLQMAQQLPGADKAGKGKKGAKKQNKAKNANHAAEAVAPAGRGSGSMSE